jgi:Fe-S cluster biogenesis protein NfuA
MENQVREILHNLNWLLEPHDSFVELLNIKGNKVVIRAVGSCENCDMDCIGTAFRERLPDVKLVRQ